jgi:hypothetical protein
MLLIVETSHQLDHRDHCDCLEIQNTHWDDQIEHLVQAFLEFSVHDDFKDPIMFSLDMADSPGVPLPMIELDIFCEFYTFVLRLC